MASLKPARLVFDLLIQRIIAMYRCGKNIVITVVNYYFTPLILDSRKINIRNIWAKIKGFGVNANYSDIKDKISFKQTFAKKVQILFKKGSIFAQNTAYYKHRN